MDHDEAAELALRQYYTAEHEYTDTTFPLVSTDARLTVEDKARVESLYRTLEQARKGYLKARNATDWSAAFRDMS